MSKPLHAVVHSKTFMVVVVGLMFYIGMHQMTVPPDTTGLGAQMSGQMRMLERVDMRSDAPAACYNCGLCGMGVANVCTETECVKDLGYGAYCDFVYDRLGVGFCVPSKQYCAK